MAPLWRGVIASLWAAVAPSWVIASCGATTGNRDCEALEGATSSNQTLIAAWEQRVQRTLGIRRHDDGSFQWTGEYRHNPIAQEDASTLTPEAFVVQYEATSTPVLISGIVRGDAWRAETGWGLEALAAAYPDDKFWVGGGRGRKLVREFADYMKRQSLTHDEVDPLDLFDGDFPVDMLDDYMVPKYFPTNPDQEPTHSWSASAAGHVRGLDLFSFLGEDERPPYRWFVAGAPRSGTEMHVDPLGTSAWNTVVSGHKLWALIAPGTGATEKDAKARYLVNKSKGESFDDGANGYFLNLWPRLKRANPSWAPHLIEFIQAPGDTVFVPNGWLHAVCAIDAVDNLRTLMQCAFAVGAESGHNCGHYAKLRERVELRGSVAGGA